MTMGCNQTGKNEKRTDFFGVNLDENGNQVKALHNLLSKGKVIQDGKVLKEWEDELGTDYIFSEGKVVSFEIIQDDVKSVSDIRDSLNLSFSERFTTVNHMMMNDWIQMDSKLYYFEYLDLYEYGRYTIGLNYRVCSPTGTNSDIESALVRVTLGIKQ
jgi:hypothetical protein